MNSRIPLFLHLLKNNQKFTFIDSDIVFFKDPLGIYPGSNILLHKEFKGLEGMEYPGINNPEFVKYANGIGILYFNVSSV